LKAKTNSIQSYHFTVCINRLTSYSQRYQMMSFSRKWTSNWWRW